MEPKTSKTRLPEQRGWASNKEWAAKLCRHCQGPVPKGRYTFCSSQCVETWKERTDPGYQAQKVLERDHGVCETCRRDTVALLAEMRRLPRHERVQFLLGHGYRPHHCNRRRLWDMDHRVPVVEGGGACGLDNLRTLCCPCHRQVTADLAARRAKQRRELKRQQEQQGEENK